MRVVSELQNRRESFKPTEVSIQNFLTGQSYRLVSASLVPVNDNTISRVTAVCQEEQVYKYLFREKWGGHTYAAEDANRFLKWAIDGWRNQTHFVFLILSGEGEVAGTIDIKTSLKESAEVGYWCSMHHRGLMTNAVKSLATLAANQGYQSLHAKVRLDNPASIAVLERAGFQKDINWNEDPMRSRYVLVVRR